MQQLRQLSNMKPYTVASYYAKCEENFMEYINPNIAMLETLHGFIFSWLAQKSTNSSNIYVHDIWTHNSVDSGKNKYSYS